MYTLEMTTKGTPCLPTCKPITGTTESHCRVCHQSFYTVKDFDRHRYDPSIPEDQDNECWEPSSIDMVLEDGVWSSPEGHEKRRTVADRLANARQARTQKVG